MQVALHIGGQTIEPRWGTATRERGLEASRVGRVVDDLTDEVGGSSGDEHRKDGGCRESGGERLREGPEREEESWVVGRERGDAGERGEDEQLREICLALLMCFQGYMVDGDFGGGEGERCGEERCQDGEGGGEAIGAGEELHG